MNSSSAEACALVDISMSGEGSSERDDVPQGEKEISLDDGLYMLSQYKLGFTSYTSLRQDLKLKVELPAHYKLMQHKNAIMSYITPLSDVPGHK